MSGSYSPGSVSTRLYRIAEVARRAPEMVITTLAHHIDIAWMGEAYRQTKKDAAVGIDGLSAADFAGDLTRNLEELVDGLKTGGYKAPPVRRVHIPKGDKKSTRPIGIPTFSDKVLQRAVAMALEAVYEQDFMDCSYGFRPGRSQHQALDRLWQGMMGMQGGWVVDLDIQGFFDSLDHKQLRSFLDHRVRDGVIRRAIDKWLKAGVMEDGHLSHPTTGTPQGGVVSPILANIYLHEVLDTWFEQEAKPRLKGRAFMVRFADDAVLVFSSQADAQMMMRVLPKRFAKFGLTIHPDKTQLVEFNRPKRRPGEVGGPGQRPGSFDFLGFTHSWQKSQRGNWVVKRKTARGRLKRALVAVNLWCRSHRHWKVPRQHRVLSSIIRGHCQYYGITGNSQTIGQFRTQVTRIWRKWLNRRSQRRSMPWSRFLNLLERYPLPKALAVHSVCRP